MSCNCEISVYEKQRIFFEVGTASEWLITPHRVVPFNKAIGIATSLDILMVEIGLSEVKVKLVNST